MYIGAHVSIAGGIYNAPLNAAQSGCECFQMFTRSPQGGQAQVLDKKIVDEFKLNCRKNKIFNYYVHTPYYINLASANNRIRFGSSSVIREDLERGSLLGAKALMTHLGSAKDYSEKQAFKKVVEGIKRILTGYKGQTQFLIENSAGAGKIIGDSFREIGRIIKALPEFDIGVCFDTCHAFVSGYDLRTKEVVEKTLKQFDKEIGLSKLKLIHANDTKSDLGSHIDRHEHIGRGKIGQEGFIALLHHSYLKNIDFILETPIKKGVDNVKVLKKLRD